MPRLVPPTGVKGYCHPFTPVGVTNRGKRSPTRPSARPSPSAAAFCTGPWQGRGERGEGHRILAPFSTSDNSPPKYLRWLETLLRAGPRPDWTAPKRCIWVVSSGAERRHRGMPVQRLIELQCPIPTRQRQQRQHHAHRLWRASGPRPRLPYIGPLKRRCHLAYNIYVPK